MKKILLTLSLFSILSSLHFTHAQVIEKEHVTEELTIKPNYKNVIGYYTSWEWYKRGGLTAPLNMDFSKYTMINYSFFRPDKDGNLFGSDAWADSILLRGLIDYGQAEQPSYYKNTSLVDLAHVAGVKVMVSIGGWGSCDNFPSIAADPKKRANFAHECVKLLANYEFDGIDIDWEFPGFSDIKGTPADKENFTLLMKSIRDSIDHYGNTIEYKFLLTGAFSPDAGLMKFIEWDKLSEFIDMFNIMTYDYNGAWSEKASHNSPLMEPKDGNPGSISTTFKILTKDYGVNPGKINLGVGFYGRSLLGKQGQKLDIYSTEHLGLADSVTFVPELGGSLYWNLMNIKDKFEEKWDESAQAPYLVGKGNLNTFVTYDNPKSIALKADFVKQNDAAGIFIWEISGDALEKKAGLGYIGSTPLIDAINENLNTPRKKKIAKRWKQPQVVKIKKEKGWRQKAIKENLKKLQTSQQ